MVALALILALTGFEFALAVPGNGQCVSRDFSSTAAPAAFGSAGAELTGWPAAVSGVRGGEFDNFSSSNLWISVSTSSSNCTGGRANLHVPANSTRYIVQGDQKFGSKICAIGTAGTVSTGSLVACVR